ncbi:hypothetical protein ABZT45_27685 [Streptomyces sp. NPDC005356]
MIKAHGGVLERLALEGPQPCLPAPGPLEAYAARFDDLLGAGCA